MCEGEGTRGPGVVAPLHLQSLGHARVKARGVIGRIGGMLRYAGWLHAQGVGVCSTMTVVNIDPHHRDLQVGDRADRCCTGVHHCVCRSSKLGACRPDASLNNYGIIVYLLPVWFLRNGVVRFLPCCCPRGFQISSILVSKLAFSIVLQHFSGDRRRVDFGPSAELTRQVEKSSRRAHQAPIPVDLLHEQAHKLMSSMA